MKKPVTFRFTKKKRKTLYRDKNKFKKQKTKTKQNKTKRSIKSQLKHGPGIRSLRGD